MRFSFWSVGKVHEPYVKNGVEDFTKRISNYYKVEWNLIATPKNAASMDESELKRREGEQILQQLHKDDWLIVLDERGKSLSSPALADLISKRAIDSTRHVVFLIGGAFGTDDQVLSRANFKWSLSPLVFPHQLVRLILAEQVYRACTIIRNEKYHHM